MKLNINSAEMQEAMGRVEKAKANKANAVRKLEKALATAKIAEKESAEADAELKSATSLLDKMLRKSFSSALKKGGPEVAIAVAELFSKSLNEDGNYKGSSSQSANERDSENTPASDGNQGADEEDEDNASPESSDANEESGPSDRNETSLNFVTGEDQKDSEKQSSEPDEKPLSSGFGTLDFNAN
jgi:hypothetical protein